MHDLEVVEGMEPSSVTPKMRKNALSYLMFLKRKNQEGLRDGGVQMDGTKGIYKKEDAASPTVPISALMISTLRDGTEESNVVTLDIPGAFLQTDQPNDDY